MMLYIVFFTYYGIIIKKVSTQNSVALDGGLCPNPDGNLMHCLHSGSPMARSTTKKLPRAWAQESPMKSFLKF